MAGETIDEIFVGLGLQADRQSFQQGVDMFNGVRTAALSLAGVIATSFGAQTVINFAQQADQAGRMADNLNVSTGYLRQLGFAFSQVGGSTQDAISDIQRLRALMDEVQTNPGGDTFALMAAMGLDPEGIAMAENVEDAFRLLIERGSALGADQRRIAFGSIGLSQASASLADEGPEFMRQQMEFSKQTAELTNEMVKQSRDFNRELNRLNSTAIGIKDAITMDLIGKLEPLIETINELMGGVSAEDASTFWNYGPLGLLYKKIMDDDSGGSPPSASLNPRDPIDDAVLRAVGHVESRNRHRDASGNLTTSPVGARGRWQIMPDTARDPGFGVMPLHNNTEAEHKRFADDYLTALYQSYEGDMEKALAAYNAGPGTVNRLVTNYGADWLRHAPQETRDYVPQVLERLERMESAPGSRDVTFNIYDATDPNKVAQVVDGRLKEMSERAAEDYRTGIA